MPVHPTAIIATTARVADSSHVWHFCHVMDDAVIGESCVLGQNCFVGRGVQIGDGTRIQNNVSVYEGVTLENDVFCGPSVVFTNVMNPRAGIDRKAEFRQTLVKRGATLGANATILPGVTIGEYAFVAAGAVVTRDVQSFALMLGTPARPAGFVSRAGERLEFDRQGIARCPRTEERYRLRDGVVTLDDR
jgi:UDP-2-acetamido-3-amino-2,3-dideoxy-glucuronate N-acetyltransferase